MGPYLPPLLRPPHRPLLPQLFRISLHLITRAHSDFLPSTGDELSRLAIPSPLLRDPASAVVLAVPLLPCILHSPALPEQPINIKTWHQPKIILLLLPTPLSSRPCLWLSSQASRKSSVDSLLSVLPILLSPDLWPHLPTLRKDANSQSSPHLIAPPSSVHSNPAPGWQDSSLFWFVSLLSTWLLFLSPAPAAPS